MSISVAMVTKAAATLVGNTELSGVCLPMLPMKASWKNQVTGVYDLIDPVMNKDYARRDEVMTWITNEFAKHQGTGGHKGGGPNVADEVLKIPKFTIKNTMKVRAGSTVNAIGYGV